MPVPAEYQRARDDFYAFLADAREEAGLWSTHVAYTMTQSVFQVFRRRVSTEQALAFANILPVGLRALFVADWDVNERKKPFESIEAMTEEVKALRPNHNFSPDTAIRDVAAALRRHVDERALDRVLAGCPDGAGAFWGSADSGGTGGCIPSAGAAWSSARNKRPAPAMTDPADLPASARRVQDLLHGLGHDGRVVVFSESTRTSAEAAAAVGCDVAQIAKSLVFRTRPGNRPVLVIASGANRVNEKAVARRLAERIGNEAVVRADAEFVRPRTGFAIGGVPPIGHAEPPVVAIDEDLLRHDRIWAAAGTPNAVFELTPDRLVAMTGGTVMPVG